MPDAKKDPPVTVGSEFGLAHQHAERAALELAVLSVRAGRSVADVIKLATDRFKAKFPDHTPEHLAKLEAQIRAALEPKAPPTPATRLGFEAYVASRWRHYWGVIRGLGFSKICVIAYVAFVIGSLFHAPWEGWRSITYNHPVIYWERAIAYSSIFSPPAILYNMPTTDPRSTTPVFFSPRGNLLQMPTRVISEDFSEATNKLPRLKTEILALLWGALGIATVAIVWLGSGKKAATESDSSEASVAAIRPAPVSAPPPATPSVILPAMPESAQVGGTGGAAPKIADKHSADFYIAHVKKTFGKD